MAVDKTTLGTKPPSAQSLSAFLFEPLDTVPFEEAWNWQREWQQRMLAKPQSLQAVWLLQHPSCYTLGRGASEANLLFDQDDPPMDLHRIDRGGEVTHHMPGQLVAYPVLDLRRHQTDLHWYLRQLEQVLIDVLAQLELPGERRDGLTGLWLEEKKVAAIGVGCRRWITQHGLALNVNGDLEGFSAVVPCGLTGCQVGRLDQWLPGLTVAEVQPLMRQALAHRFGLQWQRPKPVAPPGSFASDLQGW
ncbi:MAG: Octanoyltransferase [Prochlorococcus marinus str. MIT 9215]|nr:MAG: Octanoyltransferase [Prochlorococcus marinus str. MIT 9215]